MAGNKVPCPLDGFLMWETRKTRRDGEEVEVRNLTCRRDNDRYNSLARQRENERREVFQAVAEGEATVEDLPAEFPDKFSWVISQLEEGLTPDESGVAPFEAELTERVETYKEAYEKHVVAGLEEQGWIEDFSWLTETRDGEDLDVPRPRFRYTDEAYESGNGQGMRDALQRLDPVAKAYREVRMAEGRLERAPVVLQELKQRQDEGDANTIGDAVGDDVLEALSS